MCFTYYATSFETALFNEFELVRKMAEASTQRLMFPMRQAPLVRIDGDQLILETREWGWLPSRWKPSEKYKTRKKYQRERINARCETLHTTWGFQQEFAQGQRCILPASAFHEPFQGTDGNWFACDPPMVGIAGLWAAYEEEPLPLGFPGDVIHSCVMLTTDANPLVREHRTGRMRMPVVLNEETALQWLDPDRCEPQHFEEVFRPFDPALMKIVDPPEEAGDASGKPDH